MKTIELKVKDKVAEKFSRMDSAERNQLSKKVEEFLTRESRFMQAVRELQREAKKNGLTQEILDEILNEK
jgi:mRNA-degrading endonuclease RelE of RelBE toxin-antitoxin system